MNCDEARANLPAYHSDALPEPERDALTSHLFACAACRAEAEALAAFEGRLRLQLQAEAAAHAPAANAARRLRERLNMERRETARPFARGMTMMHKPAVMILTVLALLAVMAAAVPGVRAEVLEAYANLVSFRDPNCTPERCGVLSLDDDFGFTPYNPTYMPEDYWNRAVMSGGEPGGGTLGLFYTDGAGFAALVQSRAQGSLPDTGETLRVRGATAAVETGLSGEIAWGPKGAWAYTDASRLTWEDDDTRFELTASLPLGEMQRIARSLRPAESNAAK